MRTNPHGRSLLNFAAELYICFAVYVFLTGAHELITPSLEPLLKSKPWIHRAFVSLVVMSGLALFWFYAEIRKKPLSVSRFIRSLPIKAEAWLWILFVITTLIWAASSVIRHETVHSSFDLAIFSQAVWNTVHGRFLYSSLKGGVCLLGDHFSPLLAVLAGPYYFWPDPVCLLSLQAAAAAAVVFPVYRLAVERLGDRPLALAFAAASALYLPLRNAVRFDIHPEVFVVPICVWAFYFLEKGKLKAAGACLIVILLCKETAAFVVAAFGIYAAFFVRARFFGFFWFTFSLIYFAAVVSWVVPLFSGQAYAYLEGNIFSWGKEGAGALLRHLVSASSVSYLIKILGPLGFLSVLNPPAFLLTLPMFAQNLLSNNPPVRSIFFQYTALLTPFVFTSAIYGASAFKDRKRAAYYVIAFSLFFSGVPEYHIIREHLAAFGPERAYARDAVSKIDPGLSLRTNEFLAPHASGRMELHIFENEHPREGGSAKAKSADAVAIDSLFAEAPEQDLRKLREAGYVQAEAHAGFFLFERPEALRRKAQ